VSESTHVGLMVKTDARLKSWGGERRRETGAGKHEKEGRDPPKKS